MRFALRRDLRVRRKSAENLVQTAEVTDLVGQRLKRVFPIFLVK